MAYAGSRRAFVLMALLLLMFVPGLRAAEVADSLNVVSQTNRSAAQSQEKIDKLSVQARELLAEYRRLQDGTEYEAAFARELEERDLEQQLQIESLQRQIAAARITRQRIVPLMRTMADALEKFVVLDLPFYHEERIGAVLQLKQRLGRPELSVSARFRSLLEAYQLEQDYGTSIEAWRGPLHFNGEDLSVEFLRVGRVALYFHSLDGEVSGYWNREQGSWSELDSRFNRDIARALRVARNQLAPQLLQLPLSVPEGGA